MDVAPDGLAFDAHDKLDGRASLLALDDPVHAAVSADHCSERHAGEARHDLAALRWVRPDAAPWPELLVGDDGDADVEERPGRALESLRRKRRMAAEPSCLDVRSVVPRARRRGLRRAH